MSEERGIWELIGWKVSGLAGLAGPCGSESGCWEMWVSRAVFLFTMDFWENGGRDQMDGGMMMVG